MRVFFTNSREREVKEKEADALDVVVNKDMVIAIRLSGIAVQRKINGVFEETEKLDF